MSKAADEGRRYLDLINRGTPDFQVTEVRATSLALTGLLTVLVTAFEEEEVQRQEQDRKDSYAIEMEAGWRAAERVRELHVEESGGVCAGCGFGSYPCPTMLTLIGDGYPHDPTASSNG